MRALVAVLAIAAALALAGCSSEPNSPVDPETVDSDDYELPLVIFVVALLVGIVLVVVNLSSQDRGAAPPSESPTTPPATTQPGWQQVDETPVEPAKPAQRSGSPPKPRRRAP